LSYQDVFLFSQTERDQNLAETPAVALFLLLQRQGDTLGLRQSALDQYSANLLAGRFSR
jgi:hypothetical protein